jgi:hypothetical protein
MIKRKGRSQIDNLTFDHKSLEINGQMKSDWGMLYTSEKDIFKAYKILPLYFQKTNYLTKIWTSKVLGFPLGSPGHYYKM